MRRDAFVAKGLRIETWRDFDGRCYVCWRPDVSIYCRTRKEVLKFAAWPIKTPTGDALRAQLDSWEAMDRERRAPVDAQKKTPKPAEVNLQQTWGPEAHADEGEDPTANTRMIT
jgi:hypothetical protein